MKEELLPYLKSLSKINKGISFATTEDGNKKTNKIQRIFFIEFSQSDKVGLRNTLFV